MLYYAKFKLSREDIRSIITDEILPFFDVVDVTERVRGVCRDPYDDMVRSVAVSAGASSIVYEPRTVPTNAAAFPMHPSATISRIDRPHPQSPGKE